MVENNNGLLVVISGPSGVGKGTVCKFIKENSEELFLSVSVTTRGPRPGEVEGKDYTYCTEEEFHNMVKANQLLEYAQFCDNYYGTPKAPVEKMLSEGKNVILEIEPQGAMKIMKQFPDGVFIFLFPPSMEELERRLCGRGTESEEVIKQRLARAKEELLLSDKYQYFVINDDVSNAKSDIETIISAERKRKERCKVNFNN